MLVQVFGPPKVTSMLGQRRRRCSNIALSVGGRLVADYSSVSLEAKNPLSLYVL